MFLNQIIPMARMLIVAFIATFSASLVAQSTPAELESMIQKLKTADSVSVRIKAAQSLGQRYADPKALQAVAALKSCLTSQDDQLRYQAVAALTMILTEHDKEFPVEFLELLNDSSEPLHTNFPHLIELFKAFPPEAIDVFLKHYENQSGPYEVISLPLLARAGGKDKRVLQVLFNAVNSTNVDDRINGTAGIWSATRDYQIVIPLYFDRLNDLKEMEGLPDGAKSRFTGNYVQAKLLLGGMGVGGVFNGHLAAHHDEFVAALKPFAESRRLGDRRNLANYLKFCLSYAAEQTNQPMTNPNASPQSCDYAAIQSIAESLVADPDPQTARDAASALASLKSLVDDSDKK